MCRDCHLILTDAEAALPEPMREEPYWGKTMYVVHLDLNKVIPHQFGSGDEYTVGLHHLWLKAGLGHYREKDAQAWLDDWNRRVGRKA